MCCDAGLKKIILVAIFFIIVENIKYDGDIFFILVGNICEQCGVRKFFALRAEKFTGKRGKFSGFGLVVWRKWRNFARIFVEYDIK